uniref:Uncharacterized protein n=1 Tax=Anopheles farauti TaxID=69004 RepID=A0A182QGL1_9DIPT
MKLVKAMFSWLSAFMGTPSQIIEPKLQQQQPQQKQQQQQQDIHKSFFRCVALFALLMVFWFFCEGSIFEAQKKKRLQRFHFRAERPNGSASGAAGGEGIKEPRRKLPGCSLAPDTPRAGNGDGRTAKPRSASPKSTPLVGAGAYLRYLEPLTHCSSAPMMMGRRGFPGARFTVLERALISCLLTKPTGNVFILVSHHCSSP